ncbi:hypothetical protein Taro_034820 [Colocasia esculenta]|uniref:Pentatricopeptide repeat-containing protein n=1 Tax=Colocasia esculenta TaxID=4460 RepID=A0A843WD11_COLES|nr:hypothetical protein [Colocasia esculenta]
MDFSDTWKSTWPVAAVFPAPNLLSGPSASPLGPLLFAPSPSAPPRTLFSSPSLASPPPRRLHLSSLRDDVHAFFRDPSEDFVSSSAQADILAAVLPERVGGAEDPAFTNQLHVLRCRDGATFILFFPTGWNADEVGYLCLSVRDGEPEIVAEDGEVFRQREGFVHPHHRITGMSAIPADPPDIGWGAPVDPSAEGYLLVTTLYSVNWYRVVFGVAGSDSSRGMPSLVPVGRRSFGSKVVHACWNRHFLEESVVLLENGDLCWIKLNSKRGVRIKAPEGEACRWLSCQFGGQPWVLFVASSNAVVMVDLRSKNGSKRTILAKVEESSPYMIVHSMEKDHFIAFCKSDFDDFHFAVVSENHLLLFDTRQPLVPALKWDHGLHCPCHVAIYRLWELRPSAEFRWASESGIAILVGSFWENEFNLFLCGPKRNGDSLNHTLYAWELPSALCLLDQQCTSADDQLSEEFCNEDPHGLSAWQQKKDIVVGFLILPEVSFPIPSKPKDTSGFILVRLLSSGKLEWQRYCASWKISQREPSCRMESSSEIQVSPFLRQHQEVRLAKRHDYLKFNFLSAYLSGNLANTLNSEMDNPKLNNVASKQICNNHELWDHIEEELHKSSLSISDCLNDISIPMSLYEIASQRALSSLPSNILNLAFSKYSELLTDSNDSSFEFLEVCNSLPSKKGPSIFLRKPSERSEKWSHKALPPDCLVGPVLPLPVLLTLQQIEQKDRAICPEDRSNDDDLLFHECMTIHEQVLPEISIAKDEDPNEYLQSQKLQDEKPFFIHEPRACASGSPIHQKTSSSVVRQKGGDKSYNFGSSETTVKNDKFSIFISRTQEKPDYSSRSGNLKVWKPKCPLNVKVLIWLHARHNRTDQARGLFFEMQEWRCKPDADTYNALINAHGRAGQWRWAMNIMDDMLRAAIPPSRSTYNNVISACGSSGRWKEALEACKRMTDNGVGPDLVTRNIVLSALKRGSQYLKALSYFELMKRRGISPDAVTLNIVINCLVKLGQYAKAVDVLKS